MQIIKVKDYEALSQEAAKIVGNLLKSKPDAILGLATGSTPVGMYQNLVKMNENHELSFKAVKTYNLDEYCDLPRSHAQSYYAFMHENLFNHVDISEKNVHLPHAEGADLAKQCAEYNKALNNVKIDLQVLGIGGNGHIGFNEPGTPFSNETFIVELTEKTREDNKRFFASLEEVPHRAMTMGIKNIMAAKKILLLASGKNKAQAIKELVFGNVSEKFPASALKDHGNVIVIIDEDAASLL